MFSVLLDDLDCVCLSVWLSDLWILLWDFAVKFAVKVTSWRHYKVHRLAGSRLTEPSDKLSCSSLSYSDDSWPQDVCVRWMTSERQIRQFTCPPVGLINLNLLVQLRRTSSARQCHTFLEPRLVCCSRRNLEYGECLSWCWEPPNIPTLPNLALMHNALLRSSHHFSSIWPVLNPSEPLWASRKTCYTPTGSHWPVVCPWNKSWSGGNMAEAADISGDSEESEAGKHLPCLTSFMPHFLHGFIWFPMSMLMPAEETLQCSNLHQTCSDEWSRSLFAVLGTGRLFTGLADSCSRDCHASPGYSGTTARVVRLVSK